MITGVLLAAGRGERFGGDKLLAELADGRRLGAASAQAMAAALEHVIAVVRPGADETAAALEAAGCEVVVCADAASGMGASLARGIGARRNADGWIVGLADMPAIRPDTVAAVRTALASGARLAAPFHAGRRGHPVGFAHDLGPHLAALSGDQGARGILRAECDALVAIETDDPAIHLDVDAPADLERLPQR